MANAFDRLERFGYALSQGLRVGWYLGHYLATQRLQPRVNHPRARKLPKGPGLAAILRDLATLLRTDREAVESGLYLAPETWSGPGAVGEAVALSRLYFQDLPSVFERRRTRNGRDLEADPALGRYPDYYRRNFHFQTDGYLSPRSARLYDHQVETLFLGGADAMRRRILIPLARHLAGGARQRRLLVDLGCGTGRLLAQIAENHPRLTAIGLDLSQPYLEAAKVALARRRRLAFLAAKAERLPLGPASVDAVTASFLFHELPGGIRAETVSEIARVLKPGGRFFLLDSLQTGDHPPYDGLLARFPLVAHEPYYAGYVKEDLPRLLGDCGLAVESVERAFFAKLVVARRY
jgi:ubiquinone/menaquinone biosynthesis C-methylase UbiE